MILRPLLLPVVLVVFGTLAASALPAAAQTTRIPLKVALPEGPDTRAAGFLIAQQRGYFADAGLDVTFQKLGYGRSPIDPLNDAKADLAVEIMPIALAKRERGADVVHVAQIFQRATLALYCRATIDQPAKLAGHNVGVWLDGWESPFYAWLGRLGLSYFATGSGVTIVRQGTDAEIFVENEVDCLTTTTYRAPLALGADAVTEKHLIPYRYQDLDLGVLEDGLYARAADLKDPVRIETFRRFLAAAARGWQSLHDDPSEAERLIMALPDSARLDAKAVAESLAAVSEAVGVDNIDLGTLDDAAYDRTVLLLLTGAPDPTLAAAPSGAVSAVLRQVP
ncbi:ABC transporter substrate-binding protein [Dongia rigui]|uniref:Thiamine pyrimidine synthase n=1 Tax=Dongia rigui TaxID=940149 RepID=A0ABU5DXF2_9PROT|nr:ABC transporter substrate-binding protein [Dongia rigui]MDY0871944.1 ABC transporter substrate-binding protein [Dongia rigui]